MSHLNKTTFQLSVLAAAMLSLSACSTTPTIAGVDLGQVASKTAEVSSDAWEGTKQLLNIGPKDSELLDEVDLALMEDDADLQSQNGVELAAVDARPLLPQGESRPSLNDMETTQQPLAFGEVRSELPTELTQDIDPAIQSNPEGEIVVLASANDAQPVIMSDEKVVVGAEMAPKALNTLLDTDIQENAHQTVASEDMLHEVQPGENLWGIAKKTTGDANNWHVIADINNLAPDASVMEGQSIIIPADMVKTDYVGQQDINVVAAVVVGTEAGTAVVIEPETGAAVALVIPEKQADIVVATTEQMTPATLDGNSANIMADATALKVGAGETLWDFAKRTTGDATNWKMIADQNQFTEQQLATIHPGQKILVPAGLVRSRDENGVLIAVGEEGSVPTATVGGAVPTNDTAIAASAAVLAGTNTPTDADIKIVEAAYQPEDAIKPVTSQSLADEAEAQVAMNDGELGKVMVKGTYYPKAVYNQADFSSSLLMRVSPGTQLLVSKAIGPWLEVQTDKGVGYVHSRDIK